MGDALSFAAIAGLTIGALAAGLSYFRVATGRNVRVMRNPDGSVYGGMARVAIGVGVLWGVIGFVLALVGALLVSAAT